MMRQRHSTNFTFFGEDSLVCGVDGSEIGAVLAGVTGVGVTGVGDDAERFSSLSAIGDKFLC